MSTPTVVYTYQGQENEYYTGIPARDLTEEDVAALTDEQRELIEAGTLYEPAAVKATRSRSKAKNGEPTEPAEPEATDTPAEPAPAEG